MTHLKIKRKMESFCTTFNREEKVVIILSSLVIIFAIILAWIALISLLIAGLKGFFRITHEPFINACNTLINIVLPGWHL